MDDQPRDGPHNMAVDQWLLETAAEPVLRVYRWQPGWGSFGYFVARDEAERLHPGLRWVRRWTGGGIVDHRSDWTYSLIVPRGKWLAGCKGAESYRIIHSALAEAMDREGVAVVLAGECAPAKGGDCFVQPVEFDLCAADGRKVAGAGQRRSREGLLHQGSASAGGSDVLARRFAATLAGVVEIVIFEPDEKLVAAMIGARYGSSAWYERR